MDSESNRIKLEHSHAFIADTLKQIKVEEDDGIVIKNEVFDEDDANKIDEYFDLDGSSIAQNFKSYSHSTNTTLLSEDTVKESGSNNQTNRLELEDNYNIINKISVPANNDSVGTDAEEILECHRNYEKMKTGEKICRFCFKMCCNFKTIDCDIKYSLDVLLPGIDLAAIQEPVMCVNCQEILFMSFDFKTRCLCTRDYLIQLANEKDDGVKLNLKDIYMINNKNNTSVLEDQDICGCCMCPVKKYSAIFFDGERDVMLRQTLEQCLPELDLSTIENPVICAPCHASLEIHSRFVTNVLIIEEKIKKYKEFADINSKSQMDSSSLVRFILSEVDSSEGDMIKSENVLWEHNESVDKEVEYKYNPMDMEFNKEHKFTPTNMLDCEIESNDIAAIKIEETFCAEDGTEFKEKNVEVADKKILLHEEIEIKPNELDLNSFEDGIGMTQLNARSSVLPNFEDNSLGPHIDQTCINKNVKKRRTHLYECDSCLYQTKLKRQIKRHVLKHKKQKPSILTIYKCESCAYQTIRKSSLKSHLLVHKNPSEMTMHKCDLCEYQTIYKNALKRHLLKHKDISEVTMYKCDTCFYQTRYKSALKSHLLKHKNPSEVKIHKCDQCGFEAIYRSVLNRHLLIHKDISEVTIYKCDICSHQTIRKSALKLHFLMHKNPSEVAMHKCDLCPYQAILKSTLKIHLRKHKPPSEMPMHKCDSCEFQTMHKSALKLHFLRHKNPTEVTMHKCDSCAYQTMHKSVLKTHLLKHKDISEVTMHKCDSCLYQTKYKPLLKTHLLTHKNPLEVTQM